MANYTPGPLTVDGFRILRFWAQGTKHAYEAAQSIAEVAYDKQGLRRGHEESQANARLIAAAPDLLEALKDMLAQSGDPNATTGEFDTAAGRAFRIVQKAEGGQ